MNALATLLLFLMGGLYWISSSIPHLVPGAPWIAAFSEAALVGGLADWFAVTALFRHPLGIPVPHSAIVPKNKGRIGKALGKFVQQNFFSRGVVERSFGSGSMSIRIAAWLQKQESAHAIGKIVGEWGPQLIKVLDEATLSQFVGRQVDEVVERTNLAKGAGKLLELLVRADPEQKFSSHLSRVAERLVQSHQRVIGELLMKEMPWYIPRFVHDRVYHSVIERIRSTLASVNADPKHELRAQVFALAHEAIRALQESKEYEEKTRDLARSVVRDPLFREYLSKFVRLGATQAERDLASSESFLRDATVAACLGLGSALGQDPHLQAHLDAWLRSTMVYVADHHGDDIARLVSETVATWDTQTLVEKIEVEIGRDIQFIRINGTVVGGLVGTVLHALGQH